MSICDRLAELDLALPPVAKPVAAYVPAVRSGDTIVTSGQLPFVDGALPLVGRLGAQVSLEDGAAQARVAALNALAAAADVAGGVDAIRRIVKVVVFVNSTAEFTDQPKVANGASELLGEIFGDAGRHARSAVGVASLPLGSPVEVELTVEA
ncbi:RidA family protein [Acidipropionibacterium timonense]|uniref:RidA family protein n=1 Tax=Acidipropionibacterium timonense TaxID=2161818 RepID=UPI001031A678|nr:RidA family protein [Acidipropionibacterium timonense]